MTLPQTDTSPPIKTALLIDDEEVDQILYRRIIDRSGLVEELISYRYADEALDFLRQTDRGPIDVIFLDINMPRMDGFEFLEAAIEELDSSFATIVIVMLTTSMNPADKERAMTFDVVKDYINKPLTVDSLRHIVGLLKEQDPG